MGVAIVTDLLRSWFASAHRLVHNVLWRNVPSLLHPAVSGDMIFMIQQAWVMPGLLLWGTSL
jgi:hypothetical protein